MKMNKVAVITGSSRGIGRSIAIALAKTGWDLVLNYRSNREEARKTEETIISHKVNAITVQADIGVAEDRSRLVDSAIHHFQKVDLLVNNAGMAPRQRVDLLKVNEESYDEVMAANLKGPFFLSQLLAQNMIQWIENKVITEARIINMGSISAYTASPERSEYCISKAGLSMMTALFAARLADHGIQVYEIRPGIIYTDMTHVAKEKYDRLIAEGLTPIRRWGQPDDVANAVVAIANGALAFSTGEVINVDGGFHLRRL
jgi:3-oxoacyl-[acyl-carrier protein] reductase